MEVVITKEKLVDGVQTAERIVSTKSTLPIIGNLLFEAAKDYLKISANNLEMGLEIKVEAKVVKEGSILIPAKTLSGIVGKLPDAKINLHVSDRGLVKIAYQESHLNIHGLPAEEFPALSKVKEDISFKVEAALLEKMIEETIFAVSANEDKLVLTGILLEVGKAKAAGDSSNLRLVATDGYRLAKKSEKIEGISGGEKSVIVPARALSELSKIISGAEGVVTVVISAEQISFKFKDVHMVSRLIQGQFPDYKQVIPRKSETQITLSTELLLDATQRAAVIASSSANIIRMETKGEKLHVIANTPEVGQVDEVLPAEIKGEAKAQVAFNVRLLIDALKVIGAEKTVLELSGPLSPGLVRPAAAGANYIYVVMPIRTQEAVA